MANQAESTLNAGPFALWLANATAAIEGRASAGVPCGDCTACCRSFQFIKVRRNDRRSRSVIPQALLFPAPGAEPGDRVMGYDKDGRCPMLKDNLCSIYSARPMTCRSYDCRIFAAADIAIEENDNPRIAAQAARWRFEYPAVTDRSKHRAVKSAASFLRQHPSLFPQDRTINATQLALAAIKVHEAFLETAECKKGTNSPCKEHDLVDRVRNLLG